ncbi:cytochrome C peroxidase [Nostoc sp. LEGE 12450]|nr:cytochrome C peroxidase [Nostoc sp. LEGE 12450]
MRKIQLCTIFMAAVLARLIDLASRLSRKMKSGVTIAAFVAIAVLAGHTVSAQVLPPTLSSLKTVAIPEPDNYGEFIKDKSKAIALGKALFWDMQVGSDGKMSCATCHFHAGADNRAKNQLSPGILRVNADKSPNPDNTFNIGQPNYTLNPGDYPFHKLEDPNNRLSTVQSDSNDIASSQGVFNSKFVAAVPGSPEDTVTQLDDPVFNVGGIETRRVEPRNTPTVFNAVYNFRNFWDGRAQNIFNGVDPFGTRNPNAKLYKAATLLSPLQAVSVKLKNSSLASQAVGPPLSAFEMSADGRTFQDIGDKFEFNLLDNILNIVKSGKLPLPRELGKKLLPLRPLGKQIVHPEDSVLGQYSRAPEKGLTTLTYGQMIKAAFKPEWWQSTQLIQVDKADGNSRKVVLLPDLSNSTEEYTQIEYNWSLFFGLAIQLYESTLVSDNAPIDKFLEGNTSALTAQQQQGLTLFKNSGCIFCHGGAEFTAASVRNVQNRGRLTRSPAPGNPIEDTGFFKIGVTPDLEDEGVGADDGLQPVSRPLSEARLAQQGKFQEVFGEAPNITPGLVEADGVFKAPGLRNVDMTAPYMHNGGMLTLRQVVDFYSRGAADDTPNTPRLPVLNLSDENKEALVAFLKALTDERVRYDKAPFDHPQLFIPNGHPGNQTSVTNDGTGKATDALVEIPSVGRNGRSSPSPNFLE